MKIDASFPGGNIVVERLEGGVAWLRQDLRDTATDWFYWYFRVTEAEGRRVTFRFTGSAAVGMRGPAVSTDGGANWRWLGATGKEEFSYTFAAREREVRFAMTMPYLEADWEKFIAPLRGGFSLEEGALCVSAQGRPVEAVKFGNLVSPSHRVLLTCRHHACETMASYALEGWIGFVLSREGNGLREKTGFFAVPFVDKDGCEAGDQGKNRRPHDHNRDYNSGVYPETVALRGEATTWGRIDAVFDLHCPWLRSGMNEMVYLVGSEAPGIWREQQRFAGLLEKSRTGPLPYLASDNLPYGKDWNVASSYGAGMTCTQWAARLPGMRLASSVEVPYADARDVEVNRESARALGADLARAFGLYLESL